MIINENLDEYIDSQTSFHVEDMFEKIKQTNQHIKDQVESEVDDFESISYPTAKDSYDLCANVKAEIDQDMSDFLFDNIKEECQADIGGVYVAGAYDAIVLFTYINLLYGSLSRKDNMKEYNRILKEIYDKNLKFPQVLFTVLNGSYEQKFLDKIERDIKNMETMENL